MNKEVQRIIRKRNEKVDAFLFTIEVIAPVFQNSAPTDTTNLCRNTKFCTLIRSEMYRYLKSAPKGSRFKDVRIRHTLEDIVSPDFSLDELTDKGKLSVYAVLMNRAKEVDLFGSDTFKDNICSAFIPGYVSKIIDSVPKIAWEIITGSMIVDTIPDVEEKWLDVDISISTMAQSKYDDTTIIINNASKVSTLMDLTDDYIDYVTMLLGINLFKFVRKLDDESQTQIYGNIGDLTEFRKVAYTVFMMELLSIESVDEWILKYLVQNIDILM